MTNIPDDPITSAPINLSEAQAKCEDAADSICDEHGGHWEWLDSKHLRIWNAEGAPLLTLHIEECQ